jgi:uncharacterized protein YdeI (YjbR/CyaY-like superfamily)
MATQPDLPILPFASQKKWEQWLHAHHEKAAGVWLKIAKKDAGIPTVTYAEAVESALCYGWIDGQKKSFDDKFFLQKFTPRRPKSIWSKINCEKVEQLIKDGRMRPAGMKAVESAKADGRWDAAYASQNRLEIPADFQEALDANPKAKAFFSTIDSANRYAMLGRIVSAKKQDTRDRNIAKFIEMLAQGKTIYPQRMRKSSAAGGSAATSAR